MQYNDKVLKAVWTVELEIMDVFDRFCQSEHLKYSIAYGTMLGAVRHNGFIPWDDDVDIIMPREDYEKLVHTWDQSISNNYILQNKRTNWDFTQNFTKIRRNNTTFIQSEREKKVSYHTGIFIDIFPGDRVAPTRLARKKQIIAAALNLLYARDHTSNSKGIQNLLERMLLTIPNQIKKKLYIKTEKYLQKWNWKKDTPYFFPNTIDWAYRKYPANLFENLKRIEFSHHSYQCVEDPDLILSLDYGDYMLLPPEKDRQLKHHPLIIDVTKNYEKCK